MSATFYRKQGSVGLPLFIQLTDRQGRAVDLTDTTNARVSLRNAATGATKVDAAAATIANATYFVPGRGDVALTPLNGVIVWEPSASDLDTAATFEGLVRVDFTGPKTLVAPDEGTFQLIVSEAF